MAHALYGHDGPCENIHGHTYQLSITIAGCVPDKPGDPKDGMVVDFSEIKRLVNDNIIYVYDHALTLNKASPQASIPGLSANAGKVILMEKQPTCENILLEIVSKLKNIIPGNLHLARVKLEETPTSYAEWLGSENE